MEFIDLKSQYATLRPQVNARIQQVLDHGQYIMGPEVHELEAKLATYTGAAHCVTVSSGTEALLIALMAIGIEPGDEVITTAFSFVATAEVIALVGAKPVFVDIEPDTCNIDVSLIEKSITERTRAIIPVSLYGQPADMDEINAIANRYGLIVIEDAAQSFGAVYKERKSCNLSTIGCTSFFPSKPLGCYGDGGALFTSDDSLAEIARELRIHGQRKRYVHSRIGVGGRMDTLQCAVVLAKFDQFEWEIQQRQRLGELYNSILADRIDIMQQRTDRTSVFAQYTVSLENRGEVQTSLQQKKIPTAIHYPIPIPFQDAYRQFNRPEQYPVSIAMSSRVMSLPMGPYMREDEVEQVCDALLHCIGKTRAASPATSTAAA